MPMSCGLGFLDGKPGLIFCGLLAFYDFLASANRFEQQIARDSSTLATVKCNNLEPSACG